MANLQRHQIFFPVDNDEDDFDRKLALIAKRQNKVSRGCGIRGT